MRGEPLEVRIASWFLDLLEWQLAFLQPEQATSALDEAIAASRDDRGERERNR